MENDRRFGSGDAGLEENAGQIVGAESAESAAGIGEGEGEGRVEAGEATAPSEGALLLAQDHGDINSGASWFFWIFGLSIVNSLAAAFESDMRFMIGTGVTMILDTIGTELELQTTGRAIVFGVNFLFLSVFVVLGVLAKKGRAWPFWLGFAIYGADTLLVLTLNNWLSVAFHGFALYFFFKGGRAAMRLQKAERGMAYGAAA